MVIYILTRESCVFLALVAHSALKASVKYLDSDMKASASVIYPLLIALDMAPSHGCDSQNHKRFAMNCANAEAASPPSSSISRNALSFTRNSALQAAYVITRSLSSLPVPSVPSSLADVFAYT